MTLEELIAHEIEMTKKLEESPLKKFQESLTSSEPKVKEIYHGALIKE